MTARGQNGPDEPLPSRHRTGLRIVSVLAGVVLGLMVAELAVRVLGIRPTFNVVFRENLHRSNHPDLEYELMPGSPDGKRVISSAGLRDREFALAKPPGVFRIAVLGDSVTYGMFCEREEAYPKQLERMLNRCADHDGPRYEVMNLGVVGYNARHIPVQLRVKALPYEPDLIVYGYVLNDPQEYSLEAACLERLDEQSRFGRRDTWTRRLNRALSHLRLFALLRQLAVDVSSTLETLPPEPAYEALDDGQHEEYLRLLHEGDSWIRVRSCFSELADATQRGRSPEVLVAVFPIGDAEGVAEFSLSDVQEKVTAEIRESGLHALDLAGAYRTVGNSIDERLFLDFLHPSVAGHQVAAAAILKWLAESDVLPRDAFDLNRLLEGEGTDAAIAAALIREPDQ